MTEEIKINKANKSITFINNGIAYSQFGIADEILDLITNLQQENEILKELNICVGCENNPDYKSRCEKAMELINKNSNYPTYYLTGNIVKELKNILNGSDENE